MLIDIAISGDINVMTKEAKSILIYKDHTIEVQHVWNETRKVIHVIIWATGTVLESLKK